jgi:hypothetical protein
VRSAVRTSGLALAAWSVFSATAVNAATLTFYFNGGLGAEFETFSTDGLFAVDTSGQNVRISKPADDIGLRSNPNEFISGGVRLNVALGGDFTATVDFTLTSFPITSGQQLNESVLSATSILDPADAVSVLRFTNFDQNWIEAFDGAPRGLANESAVSGRYRLSRSGAAITASYAIGASPTFLDIATVNNATDPFRIVLAAVQGANSGPRSSTALDISFDNLIVEADFFVAAAPEPASLALLGLGLTGLGFMRRRRTVRSERKQQRTPASRPLECGSKATPRRQS